MIPHTLAPSLVAGPVPSLVEGQPAAEIVEHLPHALE
jgi:hypothetical protein